jgi:exodeoxyribonuclease V alpha subunit
MLLTRNLLYTAVTRGAGMVILVGKPAILEQMIENNRRSGRCTMLCEFLASAE